MSLSTALNNAFTGLKATSTQTDLIANNVANALTENYARRSAVLTAANTGGEGAGVRVTAVARAADPAATAARRIAEAEAGGAAQIADARRRLAAAIGGPGEPGALSTTADDLTAALAAAADTPESASFLSGAVTAAKSYANSINRIATETMRLRTEADASIARQVDTINSTLSKLQSLNLEIKGRTIAGQDTSALQDESARLIKEVSSMIPVRAIKREFGTVALFAQNGGQLLDGGALTLEFSPTPIVTPEKTLANGALSGLSLNGLPITIGGGDGAGLFDGGSLAAAFEVRDRIAPEISDSIDGLAADLINRVQGLPEDPTLAIGDAGLFTDSGAAFAPANQTGLALRLSINAAVDPTKGGEAFRLRDGLAAATPGVVGADAVLRGLEGALAAANVAPTGGVLSGIRDSAGFAAEFGAFALTRMAAAEDAQAFRAGRLNVLRDAELTEIGVDTDQELSRLLVVEQAFAANARVVEVIDELMNRLTRI